MNLSQTNDTATAIADLTKKYNALRDKKTRIEAQIESAEKTLSELRDKAIAEYGTSDVGELRAKLEATRLENQSKCTDYAGKLAAIQEDLDAIDAGKTSDASTIFESELDR